MNTKSTIRPLTRAQAKEALETMPLDALLGSGVSRELTAKQKKFARAVAMGETGAGAYRKAYSAKAKPKTAGDAAHRLKGHSGIAAEIEAFKLAQAAAEYRTPASLRALVIQTLVEVAVNPDEKAAVRVNAAKVLGTVTEVAAFTERKEVRTISSSEDARARIMAELKTLMLNTGEVVDTQAKSLLDELANPAESPESRGYIEGESEEVLEEDDSVTDSAMGDAAPGDAYEVAPAVGLGDAVDVQGDPTPSRPPTFG
jgi:hypothetical protein